MVDLRSDTVTRPTPAMRRAMAEAEVGDDVYGEDPTVRRLERQAAERLGHEAALFVPSGTMANQIAVQLLARRGSDVLAGAHSHVNLYELGGVAAWSGATLRLLDDSTGCPDPRAVAAALPAPSPHSASPTLLLLENTHNWAGGIALPPARQEPLLRLAREHGLAAHLDGARLFNAAVACGCAPRELCRGFDSVMFCLSKGLGAPVGSLLCGGSGFIAEARTLRRRMGGAMRQAGVIAAAGLYALEHHVERLADDHRRARRLAAALAETRGLSRVVRGETMTNIVIVEVEDGDRRERWLERLRAGGVLADEMGPRRIRFVTHLDVDDAALERAARVIGEIDRAGRGRPVP